jgi:lipopolysaccharide biosynthesis glycosyltransferase
VYSALLNAPKLEPILIYNGSDNEFTREMKALGVEVIFHRLSFEGAVNITPGRDGLWRQTAKGAMLRLDIPELINTNEVILYTDTDVFFLKDPSNYQFDCDLIAVAPEFEINNYSKINTGAMLINLGAAREQFKSLIEWTVKNLEVIPDYDQGAVQIYFNGKWNHLHQFMNWKPYWGIHNDAIILHFHGPKPDNFDSLTLTPKSIGGIYETLYSANPLAYMHYLSAWISICHQYQANKFERSRIQ